MKSELLIAAGCVAGIVGVRVMIAAPHWIKQRRENRQFIAVNNLTPERLFARCGPPSSDETKDLYPMLARDVSYRRDKGTIIIKFSRTSEESSSWVFMSMEDASGASYDSPSAKVAVFPCLDSER